MDSPDHDNSGMSTSKRPRQNGAIKSPSKRGRREEAGIRRGQQPKKPISKKGQQHPRPDQEAVEIKARSKEEADWQTGPR